MIWASFDSPEPLLSHEEFTRWPADDVAALQTAGVLVRAASTDQAACPDCPDRHVEEVTVLEDEDGQRRYFIPCPDNLRVEISPSELQRWTIDFDTLARILAKSLNASGRVTSRVPGRLWRLGRVDWHGAGRDVLLARGLRWFDGAALIQRIDSSGRDIVFVADDLPPDHVWPGLRPPLVALSAIASWQSGAMTLRVADLAVVVRDADARNQSLQPVTITPKQQKRAFRQAAGDVLKSALKDDMLVESYRENGSLRKAAEALTREMGFTVTKERVSGAVDRRGGIDAVRRGADSESVRRTVASQPRDRKKRFASPTQPPGDQ